MSNSQIRFALIEIRFEPINVTEDKLNSIQEQLGDVLPRYRTSYSHEHHINADTSSMTKRQIIRGNYQNKERTQTLVLENQSLHYTVTQYTNGKDFIEDFLNLLTLLAPTYKPRLVQRIGFRYGNGWWKKDIDSTEYSWIPKLDLDPLNGVAESLNTLETVTQKVVKQDQNLLSIRYRTGKAPQLSMPDFNPEGLSMPDNFKKTEWDDSIILDLDAFWEAKNNDDIEFSVDNIKKSIISLKSMIDIVRNDSMTERG